MATDKKVQIIGEKVVFVGHETKAVDGKVSMSLTFDFAGVDKPQLLKWAAANRLIAWRTTGVKDLTVAELQKLNGKTIVCKDQMEHVESETERKARKLVEMASAAKMPLEVLEKMFEDYKRQAEEASAESEEEKLQTELETGEES